MKDNLPPTPWTPDEVDRLEWLLGGIEAKRLVGEALTADEQAVAESVAALTEAEQKARVAFTQFYAALAPAGEGNLALPASVAQEISGFVEARRRWEERLHTLLRQPATAVPIRTGTRLRAKLPDFLRLPRSLTAQDVIATLLTPTTWQAEKEKLVALRPNITVQVEADPVTALTSDAALQHLAKQGAAVVQTFLALIGLWSERHGDGETHETYLSAYVSDVLRYQGRKETPRGGYHRKDLLARGRDIYLLSRVTLPMAQDDGETRTVSLGRLLSLESLEVVEKEGTASVLRFRYHLGKTVWKWLHGDEAEFAEVSSKLLTYHPVRQKYHVILGLTLLAQRHHESLSLPELLSLASLTVPAKRPSEFLQTVEDALHDLARDGVLPALRLQRPANWTQLLAERRTQELIRQCRVHLSIPQKEDAESHSRSVPGGRSGVGAGQGLRLDGAN